MVPDTGHKASATFELIDPDGSDGGDFNARFSMLGELQRTIDAIEVSHLMSEDEKEKIAGDLVDPGELELEFFWDGTNEPPDAGQRATITVTLPTAEDQSAGASWTATGFFTLKLMPSAQLNTVMKGKTKFMLDGRSSDDGGTKFTYTPATAAD